MNCKEAENILLEEELGNHLSGELQDHIASCENCRKYYLAQSGYTKIVKSAGNLSPRLNYIQIADNVMREIKTHKTPGLLTTFITSVERVLYSRIVRTSLTFILLTIVSLYFFEEYSDVIQIHKLEKQFSIGGKSGHLTQYQTAGSISHLEDMLKYIAVNLKIYSPNPNNIILKENDILEVMSLFIKNESIKNSALRAILENSRVNLSDGLNAEELKEIVAKKNILKNILNKEFNQGGK
jgi:hypothetical protein